MPLACSTPAPHMNLPQALQTLGFVLPGSLRRARQMPVACSTPAPTMNGANSTTWEIPQIHSNAPLKKLPVCAAAPALIARWGQRGGMHALAVHSFGLGFECIRV